MQEPPGISSEALEGWFASRLGTRPPLKITAIAGGYSNLTYRIDDASGHSLVLRRPPLGDLPKSAHDVLREARILSALNRTRLPVPFIRATCDDPRIIGAPFFVMNWVAGTVVDRLSTVDAQLQTTEQRRRASFSLIDALADLHSLNVDATGLGELSTREDYLARQLRRLRRVWDSTKTRELPLIESLHERLVAMRPAQRHTGLVHADYRLGNVMLSRDYQVAAILDWELCTLGDVLTDVGALLANWDQPADSWENVWMEQPPTRAGGFPTREEMLARYVERTGFAAAECIDYYRAFCYWRIAVIAEGIKRRYESGAMGTQSSDSLALDRRVRLRADLAEHFLTRADG